MKKDLKKLDERSGDKNLLRCLRIGSLAQRYNRYCMSTLWLPAAMSHGGAGKDDQRLSAKLPIHSQSYLCHEESSEKNKAGYTVTPVACE